VSSLTNRVMSFWNMFHNKDQMKIPEDNLLDHSILIVPIFHDCICHSETIELDQIID